MNADFKNPDGYDHQWKNVDLRFDKINGGMLLFVDKCQKCGKLNFSNLQSEDNGLCVLSDNEFLIKSIIE